MKYYFIKFTQLNSSPFITHFNSPISVFCVKTENDVGTLIGIDPDLCQ